ncbi:Vacuolar segregation subunit 7 [Lasallia pustulata]|uniref:Vacuolar segregation subunit 7 n=1 Tax=Lasallia pustulata TaxID=136370 RepID=A0A1W5DD74_9LECA|nr:Vacuolar segregation subunit 7 [Lasallia pustulata]
MAAEPSADNQNPGLSSQSEANDAIKSNSSGPGVRTGGGAGVPDPQRSSSSTSLRPLKRASTTPLTSTTASTATSPQPSRETSPIRPPLKPGTMSSARVTRSRKNSQDMSPSRAQSISAHIMSTVPSAAAVQRAISAAGTPQLQSPTNVDLSSETPRPQKPIKAQNGASSPGIKSPPPPATANRPSFHPQKLEPELQTPSITVERAGLSSTTSSEMGRDGDDTVVRGGIRTPVRGTSGGGPTLETVQESSLPATTALGPARAQQHRRSEDDRPERIDEDPMEEASAEGATSVPESGSESGGNKSAGAKTEAMPGQRSNLASNSARPPTIRPRKSVTQLTVAKVKAGNEGSVKNMTVETETVSSIPQVAVGGGAGERGGPSRTDTGGSLRLKPSVETIRAKKDKKKTVRKALSINSGYASSKADIFEAKVASAVGEANSSDSEETFVYESNPPEPLSARPHRFHSRTPSATSMASQIDQLGGRIRPDGYPSLVGKKSMKFANNSYHANGYQGEHGEQGVGRGVGTTSRANGRGGVHHHTGRYGHGAAGHTSLFDNESPFPHAARPNRTAASNMARLSPRTPSARSPQTWRLAGSPKKSNEFLAYDLEGEGADDERTPLVGTVRSSRNRNSRRPGTGSSRFAEYNEERGRALCKRITTGLSLCGLVALLIAAIVMALIMCSTPLIDVHVKDIQNILASEQEIMLDLNVHAINPNLVAVQVSDLDVNIFAKSKHVGSSALWRDGHIAPWSEEAKRRDSSASPPWLRALPRFRISSKDLRGRDGVDKGTDPIEDPEGDSQTMLLGRIFEFDSPLIFEPSPFQHRSLSSVGEVRLAKPGNRTEEGGSERWERVIQHPFELIVRGVIRYSLPISSRTRSASIGGSIIVHPESAAGELGGMKVSRIWHPYPEGSTTVMRKIGRYRPKSRSYD